MQNSPQSLDDRVLEIIQNIYGKKAPKKPERGVTELDVLNDPNNWYDPFAPKEPKCQSMTS